MQYLHAPSDIALISAVQRAEIDVVKRLLIEDKDCINCADEKGYTAYHWAAYIDDVTILDAIYDADHDAMWRSKTLKDQTVLHIACSNASMTCIKRIVELVGGSKEPSPAGYIDRRNKHLETALHLAAGTNRVDIVQILLEVGRADPYLLDQWNRTPRKVALENGYIWTAAAIALSYNDTYDWSEDEPHNEALEIPPVVLTGTLLQLSTELRQKLSIPSSAESDSVGVFGLAKTVTEEKHMFGSEEEQKPSLLPVTQPATTATLRPKTALSKLVEFPGDPQRVAALLQDEGVALNGKDMYGITALMKFAAWNKVELLQMLLPRLTVQEVNATGGKQRLPLLHYCVDMDAWEALSLLLEDRRVDLGACDEHGRDYKEHAAHWGKLLSN